MELGLQIVRHGKTNGVRTVRFDIFKTEKCPMRKKSPIQNMPPKTALLIVDMINCLDFPEGKQLLKWALPVARNIAKIKKRFADHKQPVIYVNDNFEEWTADWKLIYRKCSGEESLGRELALILKPSENDYFILKPKHSGFFKTPLDILLEKQKIERLVITGIAGNICVLFTAHEAHMRGFKVIVPSDCIASNTKSENIFALKQLSGSLSISTARSTSLKL